MRAIMRRETAERVIEKVGQLIAWENGGPSPVQPVTAGEWLEAADDLRLLTRYCELKAEALSGQDAERADLSRCQQRTDGGQCQPFAVDGKTCEYCGAALSRMEDDINTRADAIARASRAARTEDGNG